jgi:GGDEF domain-containing protein
VVFIFVMYFYRESYRYEKTLVQSNDELTILSELDSLTGLLNRRSFSERIASEWDKERPHRPALEPPDAGCG